MSSLSQQLNCNSQQLQMIELEGFSTTVYQVRVKDCPGSRANHSLTAGIVLLTECSETSAQTGLFVVKIPTVVALPLGEGRSIPVFSGQPLFSSHRCAERPYSWATKKSDRPCPSTARASGLSGWRNTIGEAETASRASNIACQRLVESFRACIASKTSTIPTYFRRRIPFQSV